MHRVLRTRPALCATRLLTKSQYVPSVARPSFSTTPENRTTVNDNLPRVPKDKEREDIKRVQTGAGSKRFRDFDLADGVFIVTGGARGLGLCMAEALAEAGGEVHCLDRMPEPDQEFVDAQKRVPGEYGGSLCYGVLDVRDTENLHNTIGRIAGRHKRLDGLIAAAGIQHVSPATEYSAEDAMRVMGVNYTGVFMTATAAARQMMKYKNRGSICLIASMSGIVANKGMLTPVYNSSKAAVIQLTRNLAMEWGPVREDGTGGIRVNSLSPGHIMTPMMQQVLDEDPSLKEKLESENMLGRLSIPEEFKSAGLFLLSKGSSFMTGQNVMIDGGHTAW
jgi:NAD(P)-dependent dehydrogenase (short-subunit alcohol dehydrogenase family)